MRPDRTAVRVATLVALLALTACANPDRHQFFIPFDALEPAAGPLELGEGVDDAPKAIMSGVIAGHLLVGGQSAAAMSDQPEVMPAAGPTEDLPDSPDAEAARAEERQAAFERLSAEQREAGVRQAEQARLLESWMRTRVEPAVLSSNDVRRVQRLLQERGFDPGPIDGVVGPRTRAAVEQFEEAQSLPVTGDVTLGLLDLLAVLE